MKKAKDYWHMLGPGLTTGAADDDPSGIATYSQTGAKYGFQFLWLAPLTFPLMAMVQEMCARIGLVTGRGLAANIRSHFPRPILIVTCVFLFAANTFNIGANIGAMAESVQLFLPGSSFGLLVIGFTLASLMLQIFTSYGSYARYLKWLALVLLVYVFTAFIVDIQWGEVARNTFVPSLKLSREHIFIVCAILGTTISPYLFFWQTSQEVEEQILGGKSTVRSRRGTNEEAVKTMRVDIWSGMLLSNMVMFFIIATCAATLFANGITNIETASDAARALEPLAGKHAYLLFTLGIVGTGLLAVPVLAGATSYAIAETFRWKEGLHRPFKQAMAFYVVIIAAMLVGLLTNFTGLDPIRALIYSAVANGLTAPLVLVLIVLLSSNKKVMGKWRNSPLVSAVGWLTVALMTGVAILTVITLFN